MRVGVSTLIQGPSDVEFVIECERLGVDTVWVPEVWGY
ncbi:MAG TPA: F420-dependent methylene-tetrahydromethanopterin reductase, partial [Acidimicrobiaceae bacterium]|nr:F420-dependent methylene-tetrahydromethanopterin reductase [Acidimicrobiaceae bacterium]